MPTTDPIADMLTRLRNAVMAHHATVLVPSSRVKMAIARILKDEGFITDYEVLRDSAQRTIKIRLHYTRGKEPVLTGLRRVSKPGQRVYVGKKEVPRVYGGLGTAILSTSLGVMTGREAWHRGAGGEVLCYVW